MGIDMGINEETKFVVYGGQVNIAHDNSSISATQNNGINVNELNSLITDIMGNLSGLSEENETIIKDSLEMIRDELSKSEPKKSILSGGIRLLAPMVSIANGIPTLAENLQKLIGFVAQFIH